MKGLKLVWTAFFGVVAALVSIVSAFADDSAPEIKIAESGAARVEIVLPDAPNEPEKTAANELADHLNQITGATFPVVAESAFGGETVKTGKIGDETDARAAIFVGETNAARNVVDFESLQPEEIRLQALADGSLVLAGEGTRGTLYAVSTFLQDVCGVRWWSAKETFVPQNADLTVPGDLKIEYAPSIRWRQIYRRDANGPFAFRMKLNGCYLPPDLGGYLPILGGCHTFDRYLPAEAYFDARPDWFAEVDGKRLKNDSQICVTNEEATAEVIANVLKALRENPGTAIVDLSQNDNQNYCRCERCQAAIDAEGSPAGPYLTFVNKVAEAVEKEFPNVSVLTFAYQFTRKPPKTVRPRANVITRLCSIECSWLRPLTDEQNRAFADDLNGWKQIANRLHIWDYTTNYDDYLGPFPNRRSLGPNVKICADSGAVGLFEESEGDDFCEMRTWVLARLAWDSSLDPEALFDEFERGYYGEKVAPFVKEYWDVLVDRAEAVDLYCSCFGCNVGSWLDLATLNRATELMNDALETAKREYGPDSAEARRVEKSKIAVDSVWLRDYWTLKRESKIKNLPFEGPSDPSAAADALAERCDRFAVCPFDIRESCPASEYFAGLKPGFDAYKNPPEFCRNFDPGEYLLLDATTFHNYMDAAKIVDDPAGWNGKSVEMGTAVDWNVNFAPSVAGPYRVFASLRLAGKQREGVAGSLGFYKPGADAGAIAPSFALKAEKFSTDDGEFDRNFRWVDAGVVDFKPGAYFWFAHAHNPDLDAIYVDRVVLLPESGAASERDSSR